MSQPPTQPQPKPQISALQDSDGIPPGLDLSMVNTVKVFEFTGIFFAQPQRGPVKIHRPVHVYWASKDILVGRDLELGNTYVVDRAKGLSLGCLMNVTLLEPPKQLVDEFTKFMQQQ